MPRIFLFFAFLIAATSGCCHPCCAPHYQLQQQQHCACGSSGCSHFPAHHLAHWQGKMHAWFQPPRPAEVTPPVPRFHPLPARPVFEIPPDGMHRPDVIKHP